MVRALFLNSGLLGHHSVGRSIRASVALVPDVEAEHVDLSSHLTLGDRAMRRLLSVHLAPATGPLGNLDLRRWREELNVGLLARRRIRQLERTRGPFDLLHFHTQATAYASLDLMRRTPAIVSIDATQTLARLDVPRRFARGTYRPNIAHDGCVFRAAAAIVSTSRWAARDLAAVYPDCSAKVHVVPWPVDVGGFDGAWIDERARRGARRPRALFVGGDFERKGGFELLEVWRARGFGARATLDIATDFPFDGVTLPEGVRVWPRVAAYSPQWTELWRGADFFVMPTRREAFGVVFQEAAAAGLPAIGTRINAVPEIVEQGVTGELVAPGDATALAAAIEAMIAAPERRLAMGRAARRRIEQLAAPPAYARAFDAILTGLFHHRERQPA